MPKKETEKKIDDIKTPDEPRRSELPETLAAAPAPTPVAPAPTPAPQPQTFTPQQPPQPQYGQPIPPQTYGPQQPYQYPPQNPGETSGIIGLVLNFMGIGIGGLICGVISRNRSREAGAPTTLGTVSMVWGIISVAATMIFFLFWVIVLIAGIASR